MKKIPLRLLALAILLSSVGCSCAVHYTTWELKDRSVIPEPTFHQAAVESGFRKDKNEAMTYNKGSAVLRHTKEPRTVTLIDSFCPTPLTLLTGAADAKIWEERRKKLETKVFKSFTDLGVELIEYRRSPNEETGKPHMDN